MCYKIVPSEREWLTVLLTINASENSISNYYIFKRIKQLRNYILLYEEGAIVGMQKKDWIDTIHFIE